MIVLIWTVVVIAVLAVLLNNTYSRFSSYGVKHWKVVPIFGNMTRVFLRMSSMVDVLEEMYNSFPTERFIGRYELLRPTVVIRDVELVKKITLKDFEYFLDHRNFTDEKVEPLFARSLLLLRGQEWKDMRSTLSPAFTSTKIKLMVPFIEEVGHQMINALKKQIKESDTDFVTVNCKDWTMRYANDVIATCAFGINVDSQSDPNNTFLKMGKLAATVQLSKLLLVFLVSAFPPLAKRLKIKLFANEAPEFFSEIVLQTMKDRETKNIVRPDMIHLLMEAKKGKLSYDENVDSKNNKDAGFAVVEESAVGKRTVKRDWSDNDLVAQALLFFAAGFETMSTGMSFALHELALHPEIQDRLVKEIREVDAKHGGKIDLNIIQSMTYMDMVVSEALRMWPPMAILDRVCVKDYNMGKPSDTATQEYIIRKGELIMIPVWSFHHNPDFFPNPSKFDPERFSEENRHKIHPVAYMPFGLGPRNCLGLRFALCEIKLLMYQMLLNFEICVSEKTCLPSRLSAKEFFPRLEGGHWLRLKLRKSN